jgi:cytochrome c55X
MLLVTLGWSLANTTPSRAQEIVHDKTSAQLEQMVRQDCGSCHGLTFKGGLGSPLLPENLSAYSVDDLTTIILDGLPGTAMPPWRAVVSRHDAIWMAQYLKEGGNN